MSAPLLRLAGALARTWRVCVEGGEHLRQARASGRPVLFAPWHEALFPLVWHHRHQGITLLVGGHPDAAPLAVAAGRWGYGLVRGSSTRGGGTALLGVVRALRAGLDAAITPDGPRGPRRTIKPGTLAAARATGAVLLPVTASSERAWRLNSWDRFLVPGPFARVTVRYGTPLAVGPDENPRGAPTSRLMVALSALDVPA